MSWKADQIYTIPKPEIIQYFKSIEDFKEEIFLVDNLEGIRSESIRKYILSDEPNEYSFLKHTLPEKGLLVIKPVVYKTGYDKDYDTNIFWNKYKEYKEDRWDFINSICSVKLDLNLDLSDNQLKLLSYLKILNNKFDTPFLFYFCEMWGGDIEVEFAIVFNKEIKVYQYEYNSKKSIEIINNKTKKLKQPVIQIGFKHLNLTLPTGFFALHESSFDWKRYQLK